MIIAPNINPLVAIVSWLASYTISLHNQSAKIQINYANKVIGSLV